MQFKGDIDNDGEITCVDYIIALRAASGITGLTDEEMKRGDINSSGDIELADARSIIQHISGINLIDEVIENED